MEDVRPWTTGESLVPLGKGGRRTTPVAMEYAAEASVAPMVALRDGRWKFMRCMNDPDQLYDTKEDSRELHNLAKDPAHAEVHARLSRMVDERWDLDQFDADAR